MSYHQATCSCGARYWRWDFYALLCPRCVVLLPQRKAPPPLPPPQETTDD